MNWVQVIGELSNMGYTQPRIAEECKCGQATVSDLARGETTNPKFNTAQALLTLLQRARREAKRKTVRGRADQATQSVGVAVDSGA